jgi:hypothetical protein
MGLTGPQNKGRRVPHPTSIPRFTMLGVFITDAYYGRVNGELVAVQSWQQRSAEAEFACDVDDMVAFAVKQPTELDGLWAEVWNRLLSGRLNESQEIGAALLRCCDVTFRLVEAVRTCAAVAQDLDYEVIGSEGLNVAIEEVCRLRETIQSSWPWFDERRIQQAQHEIAAGNCRIL